MDDGLELNIVQPATDGAAATGGGGGGGRRKKIKWQRFKTKNQLKRGGGAGDRPSSMMTVKMPAVVGQVKKPIRKRPRPQDEGQNQGGGASIKEAMGDADQEGEGGLVEAAAVTKKLKKAMKEDGSTLAGKVNHKEHHIKTGERPMGNVPAISKGVKLGHHDKEKAGMVVLGRKDLDMHGDGKQLNGSRPSAPTKKAPHAAQGASKESSSSVIIPYYDPTAKAKKKTKEELPHKAADDHHGGPSPPHRPSMNGSSKGHNSSSSSSSKGAPSQSPVASSRPTKSIVSPPPTTTTTDNTTANKKKTKGQNESILPKKQHDPPTTATTTKPPAPPSATVKNTSPSPTTTTKPTRKTLTSLPPAPSKLAEYHAKPYALSTLVTSSAKPIASTTSRHLFTTTTLESLGLHPHLITLLKAPREHHGFSLRTCTKVQSAAIPPLLEGQNGLISSETGSGKTLSYLLPLLQQLQSLDPRPQRSHGTHAIILAPTRELAHQIHDVLARLITPFIWLVPGMITGGEKRKSEKARLRKGISILVATPGRLLDHLQNTQCFERRHVSWLILDEADRLMDLGFEKQVREVYESIQASRASLSSARPLQVIMATATVTEGVDRLGTVLMGRHVRIDANRQSVEVVEAKTEGEDDDDEEEEGGGKTKKEKGKDKSRKVEEGGGAAAAVGGGDAAPPQFVVPKQLAQQYMIVTCKLRLPALVSFLRAYSSSAKTVVFMSTCDSVDFHHELFTHCHWIEGDDEPLLGASLPICKLHGNIAQADRLSTYRAFIAAKVGVLLCTDVAARGLDLPSIDWIVQYDPPNDTTEYIHRIGRTARKGQKGHALLFLMPSERGYLDILKRQQQGAGGGGGGGGGGEPTPLSLQSTLLACTPKRFGKFRAPEEVYSLDLQQRLESAVESSPSTLLPLGRQAFTSFIRAYSAHPADLKPIFTVRSLHLGHVARSFALRVAPSSIKVGGKVITTTTTNKTISSPVPPPPESIKKAVVIKGRGKGVSAAGSSSGGGKKHQHIGGGAVVNGGKKRKAGGHNDDDENEGGSKRAGNKRMRSIVHRARKAVVDEFAA